MFICFWKQLLWLSKIYHHVIYVSQSQSLLAKNKRKPNKRTSNKRRSNKRIPHWHNSSANWVVLILTLECQSSMILKPLGIMGTNCGPLLYTSLLHCRDVRGLPGRHTHDVARRYLPGRLHAWRAVVPSRQPIIIIQGYAWLRGIIDKLLDCRFNFCLWYTNT